MYERLGAGVCRGEIAGQNLFGIRENGHLAFNDPPFTNFQDPLFVKVVELDLVSRQQQVRDGCFQNLDDVPRKAITLTILAILSARSFTPLEIMPRCSAVGLDFRIIPAGFNAPLEFLTGFTAWCLHPPRPKR